MPPSKDRRQLQSEIETLLNSGGVTEANLTIILDRVLTFFDCSVGTLHGLAAGSEMLSLLAWRGLPEKLMPQVRMIPIGKGMAGLAAEMRHPVQICNLQAHDGVVAKAGAKETKMEGSIAVPILAGESLRGVLGVAKPVIHEFSETESTNLLEVARLIGKFLG